MRLYRCTACNCWRSPTKSPCAGCVYWTRRAAERAQGRRCRNCGDLLGDDRHGRCQLCRARRRAPDFERKAAIARAVFPSTDQGVVLERLAGGDSIIDVAADLRTTYQRIHGYRAYDPAWGDRLDAALMAGRDPKISHGTQGGHRRGCRCPECREAKKAPPAPWRQRPRT